MPGSYKQVDFSLRPAKCIERKMLCEAFQRLRPFGRLKAYRYIGFGSVYFVDFILFHRLLGITNMISIESEVGDAERFEFNKPFGFVDIRYGESGDVLGDPDFDWSATSIVWLDYDDPLKPHMLDDVKQLLLNLAPGSVLLVTVDARSPEYRGDDAGYAERLCQWHSEMADRLGDYMPPDVEPEHLAEWGTAQVYRRIIQSEIEQTLDDVNWGRAAETRLRYRQLFNFHYRDTARMLTVGGLLYEEAQQRLADKCGFDELDFAMPEANAFLVEVPLLTLRERRHIDHQLHADHADNPAPVALHPGLDAEDMDRYVRYCRYFPTFTEAEL